ncbi:EAL domain-containing protein [Elioraea sp.]|uniref:sensor domain-containing protein n=1 Tax=Elioraea sp. TaxID=2185103 RepID=UPI0025BE3B12|nr:EAL domain-containing protein [Elioraea sp.]
MNPHGDPTAPDLSSVALLDLAGIGAWSLDLASGALWWSDVTRQIHDVGPDYVPTRDKAFAFYPAEARAALERDIEAAFCSASALDLELPFVTARNRTRWVHARGRIVAEAGRPCRLVGTLEDITERRIRAIEHERLTLVVSQMTNAAILTDRCGLTQWVNPALTRLTGYPVAALLGRKPGAVLQGPGTDPATVARIGAALRAAEPVEAELLNYRRDGTPYWIAMTITPVRLAGDEVSGFIAIESDVTARRGAEAEAAAEFRRRGETETLLRDILDSLPSGVIAYDANDRLLLTNRAYMEIYPGLGDRLVAGTTMREVLEAGIAGGMHAREIQPDAPAPEKQAWLDARMADIQATGKSRAFQTADGRWIQGRERRSPSGTLVGVRTDITLLKEVEQSSRRRAEEDELTGLANRSVLFASLTRHMQGRRNDDREGLCLLTFDLDHFKAINDSLGHQAGDHLLREVARRISAILRPTDTAARLGGDEFALILPGLISVEAAQRFIDRLFAAVSCPMRLAGRDVVPSLSLGAAFFPDDADTAEALYRCADAALYEAKREGRARWTCFDARLLETLQRRAALADALRQAIAGNAITIALQPQRCMRRGGHVGFEALARWRNDGEAVSPTEFVSVAEERGLIIPLGAAVLRASLAAMRTMLDAGLEPGRVAVNISCAQLLAPDFVSTLLAFCRDAGVGPDRVEIEVTETVLLDRSAGRIGQVLGELRALGTTIALDDFGTGYASLSHLQRFPVQRLKIDRSFVTAAGTESGDALIARTVISLAQGLGMETVAEGIETEAQMAYFAAHGCEIAQGYAISMPLAVDDAIAWLAARSVPAAPAKPAREAPLQNATARGSAA